MVGKITEGKFEQRETVVHFFNLKIGDPRQCTAGETDEDW